MSEYRTTEAINEQLLGVFRAHGYEGATLQKISDATGLQKSSMYHRFPQGKQSMALAVLDHVEQGLTDVVLAPLRDDGPLRERVQRCVDRISDFYQDGQVSCLLETLSLDNGPGDEARGVLRSNLTTLINGLASASREAGFNELEAKARATEAVIALEGALVISRVLEHNEPFSRAMAGLPALLLE